MQHAPACAPLFALYKGAGSRILRTHFQDWNYIIFAALVGCVIDAVWHIDIIDDQEDEFRAEVVVMANVK